MEDENTLKIDELSKKLEESKIHEIPLNRNISCSTTSKSQINLNNLLLNKAIKDDDVHLYSKKKFKKSDFEIHSLLGKGAYAKVVRAKCLLDNKIYALKIIERNFIERVIYLFIKENKLYQIYLENQILHNLDHPYIAKVNGIFEDNDKFFIVLDYYVNGDFYEFIKENAPLNIEVIRYYTAQIILALEYLHSNGIAHRDIKPENIMIDSNHNIKIIDFGTAKLEGKNFHRGKMMFLPEEEYDEDEAYEDNYVKKKRNTFVGTAEYVSPEMLREGEVGNEADLWALGCIIYQMMTAISPFKDKTEYLIFQRILEQRFNLPEGQDNDLLNLITRLLIYNPKERLGAGKPGSDNDYNALKSHPFFKTIDFNSILTLKCPYLTSLRYREDILKQIAEKREKEENSQFNYKHKNTITILKSSIVKKKSPWLHYNTRKIVLDSSPKIEYIDPSKGEVKGVIYLTKECEAKFVDTYRFDLKTPKRTFIFKTEEYESGVWTKLINETIEKYSK